MKARALEIAASAADPGLRLNLLREYLQAFVLRSLHESEAFEHLSFVGGTALRFLYGLPRFSEDLNFSLERSRGYAPRPWLGRLQRELAFSGFEPSVTFNGRKTVQVAWVRVAGLLQEAGLAALPAQKLSIKLEIGTRPPKGAVLQDRVVNRHFLTAFRHHDLPSLMAGKIHAICTRPYAKGRDWYDLLWYLSRSPSVEPNPRLLQAALDQTLKKGRSWPAARWRDELRKRLRALDAASLRRDAAPFLERPAEGDLLTPQHLLAAIEGA